MTKTLGKLRTLSGGLPHNVLAQAEYLRTLSVDGCDIKELPSSIGLLKHLRFLSLSYNPIETLPDSTGKLYLLQTLRLLGCSHMKVLPAILYRLTNLIHVPTTTLMLASRGLLELTNLHTLPRLALGDGEDGWSIDELGGLQKLTGEIHISGLEHVKTKENARKADLAGKAKVSKITLTWEWYREEISGGSYDDEDVLDGLQPHPNIISLELENFIGLMFPSWMVGGSPSPLKNLTSLKLLNCRRCQMLLTLGHLPCLKYLVLSGFKVESIGNDFYGVPLNQSSNKVNRVSFPSLTELEISEFESLKTWVLPSTGEETIVFPLLEVIVLRYCPELETMPPLDFQSLKTLQLRNVGIQSLEITKQNPSSMLVASLKTVNVTDCPALTSLPNDLFEGLTSLSELSICRCEALNIPTSLEKCASLATLKLMDCPSLTELVIYGLKSLKTLELSNVSIQSLDITRQNPSSMLSPKVNLMLETVNIWECEKLVSLPSELQHITSLKTMKVRDCPALTSLPNDLFQGLTSLSELSICQCEALNNIPTSLEECASLAKLHIVDCPSVKGPMPDFSKLKGLKELYKSGNSIELMISMLKAIEHLPNLTTLQTGEFNDEEEHELYFADVSPIQQNQSLRTLVLKGRPNIKSLPENLQLLTQIKVLSIWGFDDLEELPEWVGRLSSLEELRLEFCKNLKDIPSKEVFLQMTPLRELSIWGCPILAESCDKDDGSDWSKISHIPCIYINYKTIQNRE